MDNQFSTNDVINRHAGNCTLTKLPAPLALPQTHSVQQRVSPAMLEDFKRKTHIIYTLSLVHLYSCTSYSIAPSPPLSVSIACCRIAGHNACIDVVHKNNCCIYILSFGC